MNEDQTTNPGTDKPTVSQLIGHDGNCVGATFRLESLGDRIDALLDDDERVEDLWANWCGTRFWNQDFWTYSSKANARILRYIIECGIRAGHLEKSDVLAVVSAELILREREEQRLLERAS